VGGLDSFAIVQNQLPRLATKDSLLFLEVA
jgi:hypothetical protein